MLRNSIFPINIFALIIISIFALGGCNSPKADDFKLNKIITDRVGLFSPSQKNELLTYFDEYYKQNKIRVLLLTLNKLPESDTIDSISPKIFNETGIGGKDDLGILLILSMKEKLYRIDVGRGLEGKYPDHVVEIAVKSGFDEFRKNNFSKGIIKSLKTLKGEK